MRCKDQISGQIRTVEYIDNQVIVFAKQKGRGNRFILTGVDRVYNLRMEVDESWVPADQYLEKPVSPEVLMETVGELVGPGQAPSDP